MVKYLLALMVAAIAIATPLPARAAGFDPAFTVIHQFYAERNYKPVWTEDDKFSGPATGLPAILETAKEQGLDPQTYGVDRMKTVLGTEIPDGETAWKQAEIFWTFGLWRYASDLLGQPLDAPTLAHLVDGNIADNLAALAPDTPLYKAMQKRLAEISAEIDAAPTAALATPVVDETIKLGRTIFRPGMSAPAVPALRARMAEYGATLDPALDSAAAPDQVNVYDDNLVKAVRRFQLEHGLKDDGAIGVSTLAILNRTPEDERRQIIANMQRLREPHRRVREAKRIEVSIARFMLTAYDDNKDVLTMPVVVGKPGRQTISFRTEISGVRLNPTWTVPNTIKREDFIPLLVNNPSKLLKQHGLRVSLKGQSIDPTQVDWTQVSPKEMAQLSMWRPAGAGNPLGFYRVIMENPYDIYLHDTNHPDLFDVSMRAQSSGCVRVEKPDQLANFILTNKPGWSPEKTKEIVKSGQTKDVIIENKIPIYLDYMTAWFNDRGQLLLGTDVYALDKPRYTNLVNNVLTTQRNAQKLLDQVATIMQPEVQEARQDTVLIQTSN